MRGAAKVLVAVSLVAGFAVTTTAPASAQPTSWSIRPSASPAGPQYGQLSSVACPTTTTCFAVGASMVQQWNGTKWTLVKNVVGPGGILRGIACPGASTCIAVGDTTLNGVTTALVKRWNGTSWATIAGPAGVPRLSAIACTSTTHCFAIGSFSTDLLEWNGTSWSAATTPALPDGSAFVNLTCVGATRCFIAGAQYVNGNNRTLIEQWNGSTWSIASTTTPSNSSTYFNDVSCPTVTMCVAVGVAQSNSSGKAHTFAEHWNGTTWASVPVPTPSSTSVSPYLIGVSCTSTTDCWSVSDRGFIVHWNGAAWAKVTSPTHGPLVDDLMSIECLSATNCLAVGLAGIPDDTSTVVLATAERWNGTKWAVQPLTQLSPSKSTLAGVGCRGSVCFAVGQQVLPGGKTAPLVERTSTSGWTTVAVPRPGGSQSILTGVTCPTATTCVAVGRTIPGKTLALIWHGKSWTITKTPNKGEWQSRLNAVSCVSTTNCWAVGRYDGNLIGTLVEHWNGKTWTLVPSPSRKPSPNFSTPGVNDLLGVSCVSATFCVAVGGDSGHTFTSQETLVERWSGKQWALVKSANAAGNKFSNLASVACTSTKSCWAVGDTVADVGATTQHPFIEHWNGSAWARAASPDPAGTAYNRLLGVACPSATQCVAVGVGAFSSRISGATFAQALSGSAWHLVPTPNPAGVESAALNGVACPNVTQCNAVGGFTRPPAAGTLVERFS